MHQQLGRGQLLLSAAKRGGAGQPLTIVDVIDVMMSGETRQHDLSGLSSIELFGMIFLVDLAGENCQCG